MSTRTSRNGNNKNNSGTNKNSTTKFKLGDNIHFEVSNGSTSTNTNNNSNNSSNKPSTTNSNVSNQLQNSSVNDNVDSKQKKKKKSKGKNPTTKISTSQAHLNNPDDDYPTSRVIKQASNGDVIVERMDEEGEKEEEFEEDGDEYEEDEDQDEEVNNHQKNPSNHHHHHHHNHPQSNNNTKNSNKTSNSHTSNNHSTRKNSQDAHNSLWDSASIEEQEKLKEFWESLAESQKLELVKIDKQSIMKMFKNETRQHLQQLSQQSNSSISSNNSNNCACKYCGRRNNIIEEELESIYDNHFDDIIDFIHEVRDINDLNALPGLLFGGFHMLEEERRLQKRKNTHIENLEMAKNSNQRNQSQIEEIRSQMDKLKMGPKTVQQSNVTNDSKPVSNSNQQQQQQTKSQVTMKPHANVQISATFQSSNPAETQLFNKLLDPKLFEALESLDLQKMKEVSHFDPKNAAHINMLEKAGSLREIVRDLHSVDRNHLEKGMSYVQNMGKFFSNIANLNPNNPEDAEKIMAGQMNEQFNQGLSSFAEDLLKNDGDSFISMMEALSESRSAREELLKEKPTVLNQLQQQQQQLQQQQLQLQQQKQQLQQQHQQQQGQNKDVSTWIEEDDDHTHYHCTHHHHHHHDDDDDYDEDDEDDYDYDDEEDEDDDDDDLDDDDLDDDDMDDKDASDTESEISEEEKMQEIRRLFLIQVIKLFQERLKSAYKEKVSKDNTQKLIQELEEEEKAKKEREAKKLKQKEKAKEKKRLQQLAKEEEKRKKEEEAKKVEEQLKAQQEKLKLEQKRKKEEAKLKREEEKKRKLEETKRKEEEHRKKVEAQRKREEEAKKLKEERRKKADEERRAKEEERKQKELLKKQKEEERERLRIAREKQLAQEEEAKLASASASSTIFAENSISQKNSNPSSIVNDLDDDQDLVRQIEEEKAKLLNGTAIPSVIPQQQQPLPHSIYQTRPGSLSSTSSSIALGQLPTSAPNNSLSHQSQPLTNDISSNFLNQSNILSPQTAPINLFNGISNANPISNVLPLNNSNSLSPWSAKSRLNSMSNNSAPPPFLSQASSSELSNGQHLQQQQPLQIPQQLQQQQQPQQPQQSHVQPQSQTKFAPFNSFEDPTVNDPFMPTPLAGNNNIWNSNAAPAPSNGGPRSSSIWGSTSTAASTETPFLSSNMRSNSLWGKTNNTTSDNNNNGLLSNLNTNNNNKPIGNNIGNSNEIELIQSTIYNCYQLLSNSNQLEFGIVSLLSIYQNVKTILNKPQLSINQLLNYCQSNSLYQFDFIYDEFGNVTHLKIGLNNNGGGFKNSSPPILSTTDQKQQSQPPQGQQQNQPQSQQQQFGSQAGFGIGQNSTTTGPPPGFRIPSGQNGIWN
ncbi:NST1 [Candida pseudojiufengensis]|uniref:NST1 n=1 Tax=Candida pseudojiufengensis TaxID=497109 RepID=UPI00222540DF|nr:NST1 [Candida pseudojiufengensis]KAI5966384.1 NST1 [Candida pseudojiufengensis]